MAPPVIKITIGTGTDALEIGDWDRCEIESNMLEPADAFSVSCTNKGGVLAAAIAPGDPVLTTIDNAAVMVGRVDDVDYDDEDDSRVIVSGRDLFLFLVDAHVEETKTHKNLNLLDLAEQLSKTNWGITWVSDDTGTELIKRVKVEPGDAPWDVLQDQIKRKDVIIWLDPDGTGQIGKPDYTQASRYQLLRYVDESRRRYNNIIRGKVHETWQDRPSRITVHGQGRNTFIDSGAATVTKFVIDDSELQRFMGARASAVGQAQATPTISLTTTTIKPRRQARALDISIEDKPAVVVDGNVRTLKEAQAIANRLMGKAKFDSLVLTYTVKGFYGRKERVDALWTPNTMCDVNDEMTGALGSYFVSRRRFVREEAGDFTEVELHPAGEWLP